MRTQIIVILALCISLGHAVIGQARSPEAQLKAAQHKARVEGDLKTAIEQYKQLLARRDVPRSVAAEAMLDLAQSYEKLGITDARKLYEQILRDYADQRAIATTARERFAVLADSPSRGYAARQLLQLPNAIAVLTLLHDGRIGGTDWSTGDIILADPSDGAVSRVVRGDISAKPGPHGMYPVLSPDGRQLAYQWFTDGNQPGSLRALSMERGGTSRTLIADVTGVSYVTPIAWSRDSTSILVCLEKPRSAVGGGAFELAWVTADTGAIKTLKSFESWRSGVGAPHSIGTVSLSPDAAWIAYSVPDRQGALDRSIFVIHADGTRERRVVSGGTNDQPAWTPDGSHLVFLSNRSGDSALWSVAVSERGDSTPSIVKNGVGRMWIHGMLKSGTLVYEEPGLDPLIVAEFDQPLSRDRTPSLRTLDTLNGTAPAWSLDGRYLAFKRRTTNPGRPVEMVVRTVDTGELRTYSSRAQTMGAGRPTWYADGTVQAIRRSGIRLNLGGAALEEVSVPATLPMGLLSPDGRTLFSVDSSDGVVDIFDVASGTRTGGVPLSSGWRPARLSPDGRTLALVRAANDGVQTRLAVIGIDGSGFRELPGSFAGATTYSVSWTRDGTALLAKMDTVKDVSSIQRVPIDGGKPTTIATNLGELLSFDISPDQRRIAYSINRPTTDVWMLDLRGALK